MPALDPIISEFASTEEAEAHDAWVRAKIQKSLANPGPGLPHDEVVRRVQATIERQRKRRA